MAKERLSTTLRKLDADLEVRIRAEVGVTPAEPNRYWSIWVGEDQVGNCITLCSEDENVSIVNLVDLIEGGLREWKNKHKEKKIGQGF